MAAEQHFDLIACEVEIGDKTYQALVDTGSNTSIFDSREMGDVGESTGEQTVTFANGPTTCEQIIFKDGEITIKGTKVAANEGYRTELAKAIPGFPIDKYSMLVGTNMLKGLCVSVGVGLRGLQISEYSSGSVKEEGEKELDVLPCESGMPQSVFGPLLLVKTRNKDHFLVDTGNSFSTFCNTGETEPTCPLTLALVQKDCDGESGCLPLNINKATSHDEPASMQVIMNCKDCEGNSVNVRGNVGVDVWAGLNDASSISGTRFCFAGGNDQTNAEHKIFCTLKTSG